MFSSNFNKLLNEQFTYLKNLTANLNDGKIARLSQKENYLILQILIY